jgi:exodeoxyribonuclease VII small subunit
VTDREALSYEQARDELTNVVKRLEAGGLTLEQSLDLWERGEKLAAICAEWLDGARARLTAAMAAKDAVEPESGNGRSSRGAEDAPFLSPSGPLRYGLTQLDRYLDRLGLNTGTPNPHVTATYMNWQPIASSINFVECRAIRYSG